MRKSLETIENGFYISRDGYHLYYSDGKGTVSDEYRPVKVEDIDAFGKSMIKIRKPVTFIESMLSRMDVSYSILNPLLAYLKSFKERAEG